MMRAGEVFFRFTLISLLAFGGGSGTPLIERMAVRETGWIDEREFAVAIALGQVTPGPVMAVATFIFERVAARWDSTRRPADFLRRHATGARFAALPQPVKDEALERLTEWSVATFGGLDVPFVETIAFVLDICVYL
jgi:chromate transporter